MSTGVAVLYKCSCMVEEVTVQVPHRGASEDVVDWLEGDLMEVVGADHSRRSPMCTRSEVEYVKIPIPESAPFVGGKPELQS